MGKNITEEIRSLVIFHRKEGKSLGAIGKMLKLHKSTVQYICKRYLEEGRIKNVCSNKGPRKMTKSSEKFILREIKRNPKLTSVELCKMLSDFNGTDVNPITIRRTLKKNGYFSRVCRRKPLISEVNRKKRLHFAKAYKDKPLDYWKNVIFVDESKFSLFRNDKKQEKVYRRRNEAYLLKNLSATVKHGGESVMVWGAMGYEGVGNLQYIQGNMDKTIYLNILKENLQASAEKLGIENSFHFYQDNDPKHKALDVRLWLLYNCPKCIETPPQSPDINPIEHLWEHLERQIRKTRAVRNKKELKALISEEWNKIPPDVTKKLVTSIPSRLAAVIKHKGNPTPY